MLFHLTGLISCIASSLTLLGLLAQVRLVRDRRIRQVRSPFAAIPTEVLSLNRFVTSFLIFLAYFAFGALQVPFNHYLTWPRVAAMAMVLWILWQIRRDRGHRLAIIASWTCAGLWVAALAFVAAGRVGIDGSRTFAVSLALVACVVYTQGSLVQIHAIRKAGHTGGVSDTMLQWFILKDITLVAFALAMGPREAWPVLLLACTGLMTQGLTLWHFRWARMSPIAASRRHATQRVS